MSRYGISYYGINYYGSDNPITFDASPFTATPAGYGAIQLRWTDPTGEWAKLRIVRNSYGYPTNAFDGEVVFECWKGSDPVQFLDTINLVEGSFYYYAIYVYTTVQYTWLKAAAALGVSVKRFDNSNKMYDYIPEIYKIPNIYSAGTGSTLLTPSQVTGVSASGGVITFTCANNFVSGNVVSVSGLSYAAYNLTNAIVSSASSTVFTVINSATGPTLTGEIGSAILSQDDNALYGFLQIFGFEADYQQTLAYLLIKRYDVEKVSGELLPLMLRQFGFSYEPEIGYQQSRVLLRDSIKLLQKKGSSDGIREYIKAFASYAVPKPIAGTPNPSVDGLVIGHNLMLDYNDSSFEESVGRWASVNSTATLSRVATLTATSISIDNSTGTPYVTLTVGAHTYKVGNTITVSNCIFPIVNTVSGSYTLTSVTSTTITFALAVGAVSASVSTTSALNPTNGAYTLVTPYPTPWNETTTPASFPNKQSGILAVTNASTGAQTISFYCGDGATKYNGLSSVIYNAIPVTAGFPYTFTIYGARGSTTRTATPSIVWYDRFGASISTTTGSGVSLTLNYFDATKRLVATGTAPTGAYYAVLGVSVASAAGSASNEYYYFDCAQFEQASSATAFDEARQLHITIKATRINELTNPNFVSPFTGWTITNGTGSVDSSSQEPGTDTYSVTTSIITAGTATLTFSTPHVLKIGDPIWVSNISGTGVTAASYNGARTVTAVTSNTVSFSTGGSAQVSKATTGTVFLAGNGLKVTGTGYSDISVKTSNFMPIYYPGTDYTFSVSAKVPPTNGAQLIPSIEWYDSTNTLIHTDINGLFDVTALTTNWKRPYVTAVAPSNAYSAKVAVKWSPMSIGDSVSLDEALFENSSFVQEFFSGSEGPADAGSLMWEGGVADAGRSHYYRNRVSTANRLIFGGLTEFIPLGSTFALYFGQPKT